MDTTSLPPDDLPPVASPRRRSRGLLWAVALACVVLAIATVVAFVAGDGDNGVQKLNGNAVAPVDGLGGDTDVSGQALPDLTYVTFDGTNESLTTDGRPLVVNFWAASCIPCVTEMPDLEQFHQANPDVDMLGLQVLENADNGREMIATTGITYPVGRDPRGAAMAAVGGASLPRTIVVAPDGQITWTHTGQVTTEQLQDAVARAAGG